MASSSATSILLSLLLVAAVLCAAPAAAVRNHRHQNGHGRLIKGGLTHTSLTLYFRDVLNTTDYQILQGIPNTASLTPSTSAFGSIFCVQDSVVLTQDDLDDQDQIVGTLMGTFTSVAFDGLTYLAVLTVSFPNATSAFPYQGHLSIQGFLYGNDPVPASIVGGTGSFLLAQGTATLIPIGTPSFTQDFRLAIELYLPADLNVTSRDGDQ